MGGVPSIELFVELCLNFSKTLSIVTEPVGYQCHAVMGAYIYYNNITFVHFIGRGILLIVFATPLLPVGLHNTCMIRIIKTTTYHKNNIFLIKSIVAISVSQQLHPLCRKGVWPIHSGIACLQLRTTESDNAESRGRRSMMAKV